MDRVEEILSTPPVAPLIGFAALLLLALWILNTAARPAPKQAGLRSWLRANYWLAMVLAGLSLGGVAAIFYLVEIGISVRALVDRLVTAASDPTTDAEDLRNLATATAVLLAALAAAATLVFQLVRVWVTERQTTTAEQNLITARINEAVAGLGAEKVVKTLTQGADGEARVVERSAPNIEVRVGAILSLERISISNPPDHVRIMEILCAYVRENSCIVPIKEPPKQDGDWKQRTDTQMALTVLGRRGSDKIALEEAKNYSLDLRGANMQLTDMSEGAWQSARFESANLRKVLLRRANLHGAELRNAKLQDANLAGATLQEADLGEATLQGANHEYAHLQGANLVDASLQKADFWFANLQEAKLGGANLQKTKLGFADLQEAEFVDANLQGANLEYADLRGAKLGNADLRGAKLGNADLRGAKLGNADLRGANLGNADLRGANLGNADLRGANLDDANLQKADLGGATLKSTDLRNWTIARTFLRSVDFRDSRNLTQDSVTSAFGVVSGIGQTRLPDGLTPPAHWHIAEDAQVDSEAQIEAAWDAYQDWLATLPEEPKDSSAEPSA